jgi:hypothetical protein
MPFGSMMLRYAAMPAASVPDFCGLRPNPLRLASHKPPRAMVLHSLAVRFSLPYSSRALPRRGSRSRPWLTSDRLCSKRNESSEEKNPTDLKDKALEDCL